MAGEMITAALPPNPTLADRFSSLFGILSGAIGFEARRLGIAAPLQSAISFRIWGLWTRLRSVLARWHAGTLRPPRPRAGRQGRSETTTKQQEGEALAQRGPGLLPRRRGWLKRLLPNIAHNMNAFSDLLNDPETKEIIATAPQVGRILRPFCHILGLPLPPELMLPKRVRVRKGKKPLPPHPLAARFPDTPAARSAARALARMQAGLPVNVEKLSSVAYGYFVHPPRDDNCPLPEIGYARARPLPKDYQPAREEAEPPPATAPPPPPPVDAPKPRERRTFIWPLRREI